MYASPTFSSSGETHGSSLSNARSVVRVAHGSDVLAAITSSELGTVMTGERLSPVIGERKDRHRAIGAGCQVVPQLAQDDQTANLFNCTRARARKLAQDDQPANLLNYTRARAREKLGF